MMRSWYLVILAVLALSLSVGCKKDTDKSGDKADDKAGDMKGGDAKDDSSDGPSAEEMADRMLSRKLQAYIKMTNYISDAVYKSRQRYFQWLKDPKKGPTCKERFLYGLFTLRPQKSYFEAVEKAQKLDPEIKELQDGATAYMAALRKLKPLIAKAQRYYSQKDYKDDKCKGAKAMHPQLMVLFTQFIAADKVVGREIEKLNLGVQYRGLARIAKKLGKTSPRYYHKRFILDARTLLVEFSRQRRQKKPDHEKLAAGVTKINALYTEMAANTSKGKQPSGYSSFRSAADSFVKGAKEMRRRLKSGKKFSKYERRRLASTVAYMVKGSYPALLKAFNNMIGSANRVRFRR